MPMPPFLAGQVAPEAGEAREEMLQLGQFDLELAFAGPGSLGENIKDERGAVENLAIEDPFEVAALGGGKFLVEDDGVDVGPAAMLGELIGFAFADEGGGARGGQFLDSVAYDFAAGSGGQLRQFFE
jgi:hypothetical protein